MNSLRRTMFSLLVLLPLSFAACTPATDTGITGRAVGSSDTEASGQSEGAEALQGRISTQRIAALVGYEGDYKAWGVEAKGQVLPTEDFYLLEVDGFVLVIESALEKEEALIVSDFLAEEFRNEGKNIAVYRFLGFASAGGLGSTRFKLEGSAVSIVAE